MTIDRKKRQIIYESIVACGPPDADTRAAIKRRFLELSKEAMECFEEFYGTTDRELIFDKICKTWNC